MHVDPAALKRAIRFALVLVFPLWAAGCDNPLQPVVGGYELLAVGGDELPVLVDTPEGAGMIESGFLYLGEGGRYQLSVVVDLVEGTGGDVQVAGAYDVSGETVQFRPDDPELLAYQGRFEMERLSVETDVFGVGETLNLVFVAETS